MNSPFDLAQQNSRVDACIVAALERIAEAFRVLLWNESKETALSPTQIQLLIFIKYHASDLCTVTRLAANFNLSKPTISDSIRVLLEKKFIVKFTDPADTRSSRLMLTETGQELAGRLAAFASPLEASVQQLESPHQESLLSALLGLIDSLQRKKVINTPRMCYTCGNFRFNKGLPYCEALLSQLANTDIRIDCPEYMPACTQE